jgi:predicted Zn-dependent peptidase
MRVRQGLLISPVIVAVCNVAGIPPELEHRAPTVVTAFHGLSRAINTEQSRTIYRSTLPNGLRVVIAPDRTVPVVTVNVLYQVGYVDDPPGRDGMAHLVEHMMFKGSKDVFDGEQYALVAEAGGYTYGRTDSRITNYSTTLPSNQLEMVLRLESDRMRDLRMTEAALENQKRAVEAETANSERYAFPSAEIAYVTNGAMLNIEPVQLSEAQALYDRFYGPNNAVVVVTGDVNEIKASRLVAKYFSAVPKLHTLPNRIQVPRPPEARHRLTHPTRRTLNLAYPVPLQGSTIDPALAMLVRLAGAGQTARLRERLIAKANLASDVAVFLRDTREQRWFIVTAVPAPGRTMNEVEMGVRRELEGLASEAAGPAEFERILNPALAGHARSILSSESRADLLGQAELFSGDARIAYQRAEHMRIITPSDLQRLARKYLLSPPQLVVIMEPMGSEQENRR